MNIAAGARGYKMQFLVSWDTVGLSQERFENRNANNVVALFRIHPAGSDRVCFQNPEFCFEQGLEE